MKRLVLRALLLGVIGGFLKDLLLIISSIFYPDGRDIYANTIGLFTAEILFVTPSCMTKGINERSPQLIEKGALIGVIVGTIIGAAILALIAARIRGDYILVTAILLGVAAGVSHGFNGEPGMRLYFHVLSGLIGGVIGVFVYYLAKLVITSIAILLTNLSLDVAVLFDKFLTPPIAGAALSVSIWSLIALTEGYFTSRPQSRAVQ